MPAVIDATIGGPAANSFETLAEAQQYFDTRLPMAGWDDADDQTVLLIMACRVLCAQLTPMTRLVRPTTGAPYYLTRVTWTGAPATTTQKLPWPRTGMFDANGNAIPSNVIPQELKDAQSEFAGQLGTSDRTLDNDVIVQGITSVKAGSVAVSFKNDIEMYVIPDAVWNLMPASWFTDEIITPARPAEFDVVSE
jgi:hypothetical protein